LPYLAGCGAVKGALTLTGGRVYAARKADRA
jgi:hypothetical protein